MYFLEDTCMPSDVTEISFCENALEFGILNHKAILAIEAYESAFFTEDGDEKEDSVKADGLFQKMKEAILNILDKIDSVIRGFIDGVTGVLSKNRLTSDVYMQSETAKVRLQSDLFDMQRRLDNEYAKLRPIVAKISNMTGEEAADVAKQCDELAPALKMLGTSVGVSMVRQKQVEKLAEHCVSQMDSVQKWRKETEESIKRLKRDTTEKETMTLRMKAMQKAANAMNAITCAYKNIGDKAANALKGVKKKIKHESEE